jgi:hypothetical protein
MLARTTARDERAGERRHAARGDAAGTRAWANIGRLGRKETVRKSREARAGLRERAGRSEARGAGRGREGRCVVDGSLLHHSVVVSFG